MTIRQVTVEMILTALTSAQQALEFRVDDCRARGSDVEAQDLCEERNLICALRSALREAPIDPKLPAHVEAEQIENRAAEQAYRAELGVSEWEAFLTATERVRLNGLADLGCGTWGRERPKGLLK